MKPELISLKDWIEGQNRSYDKPPVQQKEEAAHLLDVGVATIYRWLKAGNVYIEETDADHSGEGGPLFVWKMEKMVEA